jgi:hypothetical protein
MQQILLAAVERMLSGCSVTCLILVAAVLWQMPFQATDIVDGSGVAVIRLFGGF